MAILRHIKRLKYIDYMIKHKSTGDLQTFANKNNLCKSAMAGVIQEMKELGFPIKYDKMRKSYYYEEDGQMVQALFIRNGQFLTKEEFMEIKNSNDLCFSEITVFELCGNI